MATAAPREAADRAADLTPTERAAAGKAARQRVPRSSHGKWEPATDRPDPVEVLERQAAERVPELVPLRYGRMLASPFTFYRGAAAIMAADLAATPSSGLWVQACGDAHLSNFGGFASPARGMVVDVNDFDETLPGPWEWDVKRLAASFEIGARDRGFDDAERTAIARTSARAYREHMRELAELSNLDVWYRRVDIAQIRKAVAPMVSKEERKRFDRTVAKAQRKTRMRAFSKLTRRVDGELRMASDPPVLVPFEELFSGTQLSTAEAQVRRLVEEYGATLSAEYRRLFDSYRFVHAARKVVGVGSVGTRAWVALFVGRDEDDPLFLQIKEAQPSVLEPYTAPTEFPHQGQRVVVGQRLTQATGDILLGWLTATGPDSKKRDFYVRQLWDEKGSAIVELMSPRTMGIYAQVCGGILARAHARSGDRIAIAGYLGGGDTFDRAIPEFAAAYADQNEDDYRALKRAADDGRIAVESEGQ
ncbi:MAG TPA: DUF2252 domain-containing protein [Solirubrobacterales bacterium]|nr:DUF2252 domain-containing protein [Solirubrobacterales bacterium]